MSVGVNLSRSSSCWVRSHVVELVGVLPREDETWEMRETELSRSTLWTLIDRGLVVKVSSSSPCKYQTRPALAEAVRRYAPEMGEEFVEDDPLACLSE